MADRHHHHDLPLRRPQLLHPPHKGRMRNAQIARELFAGQRDHHVLHQCVEEFVEFKYMLMGGLDR